MSADAPGKNWKSAYQVETERLQICPCDGIASAEIAIALTDLRVSELFWGGHPRQTGPGESNEHWTQHSDDYERLSRMNLVVRDRQNGDLIGMVQFEDGVLSYFVVPRCRRQGYGTEMVEACSRTLPAALNLKRVYASVLRENVASRRILERTGFVFNGLTTRLWNGRPGAFAVLLYSLCLWHTTPAKRDHKQQQTHRLPPHSRNQQ